MFTYDKALVMEMLHQNIALEKKALAALPAENAKRVEEWRKLVVKFVRGSSSEAASSTTPGGSSAGPSACGAGTRVWTA